MPEAVQQEKEREEQELDTKINKVTCKGFKSFQQNTAIPLFEGLTAIVGENGNGKCVTGDTEVLTSDGEYRPIREIVEDSIESDQVEEIDDGYLSYSTDVKVESLNPRTLKSEEREVLACAKREAPEELREIKTHSGRKIKATDDHPLFKLVDGEVVAVDSSEVEEGERIAVPRKLKAENGGEKIFTELLDMIEEEETLYVPYREQFENLIYGMKEEKGATWKELASEVGVSYNTLRCIRDEQSCRFSSIVKILRHSGMSDEEVAQQLKTVTSKTRSEETRIPWKNTPEFSRMLGYLLAEGRVAEDSEQLWFTNGNEKVIQDYISLVDSELGVEAERKEYNANCWDVIVFRKAAKKIMEKFGLSEGSGAKEIAEFYKKKSGQKEIEALLEGIFSGDGDVSHCAATVTTKSRKLAEDLQGLMLRIGVNSRIKERVKTATNTGTSGTYYDLRVSGKEAEKLANKLNIPIERKQKDLEQLSQRKNNTNIDLIEANGLVKKTVDDSNISPYSRSLKEEVPKLSAYYSENSLTTREGLREVAELFSEEETEEIEQIRKLANSDIYWDEIESVEKIEAQDDWVYDLNIGVGHNFVANNIFVHNSNLLDAISFVFGRRSSSLRAEKLTQLIFNGAEDRKEADHAKVDVYLDNSSGIFDEFLEEEEEAEEVVVSRKVTRAGSSIYKFQGSNCKKGKIDDIAEKANIDPDGFHFVRQGKVTEIVEQSNVERRKVIDELSGVAKFDSEKEEAEEELEEVEEKLQEQQIKLNQKKSHLEKLKEEKELALKYRELEERKEKLEASRLEVRKRALSNQLANINTDTAEKEDRIEELEEELEELDEEIEKKQDRIEEIEDKMGGDSDIQHLETRIEKKKGKIENKRERIEELEETIEDLEKMQSRNKTGSKAVDSVISLGKDGVHGAFQDLISADERYGVAIETAAGGHMNDVVVEDKDVAMECINYLKREGIGRARMLPLDKIKDRSKSAKSQMAKKKKGVIDYATELVNYDERYEKAVNHVFSDTLIAEDLDSVKNIDGVRVVTLDGDVMSRGGSMTGGKKKTRKKKSKKLSQNLDPEKKREEKKEIEEEIEDLQKDIAELKEMKQRKEDEEESDDELREEKQELRDQLKEMREERQEKYSEKQRLETKVEDSGSKKANLKAELENVKDDLEDYDIDEDEMTGLDSSPEDLKKKKKKVLRKQNSMGPVNMRAIEEYKQKKEEFDEFKQKVSEVRQEKLEIEDMIEEIDRKKRECFMETLEQIQESFGKIFEQLFGGGNAELVLEEDDIEKGLKIRAEPPGKEPHIIQALSGGEKTLTAIAFVFAILEYEKSPFYIMDEIDAALDKKNSKKLSELLKNYASDNQFIVISHNEITVRHAERAYGVSMTDGVSKMRSIELEV
ncbi:MAG: LAGLIDADG family homing endonuclease [Candidatus Nanohaloarchaea archaeon]